MNLVHLQTELIVCDPRYVVKIVIHRNSKAVVTSLNAIDLKLSMKFKMHKTG